MDHSLYYRTAWNAQTTRQREQWLKQLEQQLPSGFVLQRLESFSRYGQTIETGIFTYEEEDTEFVYVPGNTVTLGWEQWPLEWDAETQEDLADGLGGMEMEIDEAGAMILQQMSPVRQAHIPPLLVERYTYSVGWYPYDPEQLDPHEDADLLERLQSFRASSHHSLEVDQTCLLERDGEQVNFYLFSDTEDVQEWTEQQLAAPFTLPTEDEWEYLYGGGCRTLFPWGDNFDYTMKVKHFGDLANKHIAHHADERQQAVPSDSTSASRPYDLELPNAFGLHFAGDPYRYELTLTADGQDIDKGGDGGSAICGGVGVMLGYLPVATYYRNPYQDELDWAERMSYMQYRRIVRLASS